MEIETIRMEAHYSALLNERCRMIINQVDQIVALKKRIEELEESLKAEAPVKE